MAQASRFGEQDVFITLQNTTGQELECDFSMTVHRLEGDQRIAVGVTAMLEETGEIPVSVLRMSPGEQLELSVLPQTDDSVLPGHYQVTLMESSVESSVLEFELL